MAKPSPKSAKPAGDSSTQDDSKSGAKKRIRSAMDAEARRILRTEMSRREISYKQLAAKLERAGHGQMAEGTLVTRITRGTFSFAFAIEVLRVIGATELDIRPLPEVEPTRRDRIPNPGR